MNFSVRILFASVFALSVASCCTQKKAAETSTTVADSTSKTNITIPADVPKQTMSGGTSGGTGSGANGEKPKQ